MKNMKKKKTRAQNWQPIGAVQCQVFRGGRVLTITISGRVGQGWLVGMGESSIESNTLEEIFKDHSHDSLGPFDSLIEAISESEFYAYTWSESKSESDECGCEPILLRAPLDWDLEPRTDYGLADLDDDVESDIRELLNTPLSSANWSSKKGEGD